MATTILLSPQSSFRPGWTYIHELQERVGILEHTLTSVLERLEQHEERLERQWHISASQLQMPSPVNHSYNPPINTSSPQTPHRFLQPCSTAATPAASQRRPQSTSTARREGHGLCLAIFRDKKGQITIKKRHFGPEQKISL